MEVRRGSGSGACFVDRRIHEFVEDVLNSGGRSICLEKARVLGWFDGLGAGWFQQDKRSSGDPASPPVCAGVCAWVREKACGRGLQGVQL